MLNLTQLTGFGGGSTTPADVTPDAIDITNISGTDFVLSNVVSISGINQSIVLRATCSSASGAATGEIAQLRNGAEISSALMTNGSFCEGSFVNGDTLRFAVEVSGSPGQGRTCTVTLSNQSDGGAVIDTFTAQATAS